MQDSYEFGGFRLDGGLRRLTDASGRPIDVSSRAFDLLLVFTRSPGELLDKSSLMKAVWPDTIVEENDLNQLIASLRKALGDSPKQARFIATEAGRGYRFVAAVESARDINLPPHLPVIDGPSVAVLPFVDMSPDRDQEYFSDGITEEFISQLSKLRGLHVAGRTSSFVFKNHPEDLRVIAEKLSVAHILEGSVRKAGDRLRIAVQLVKASDGYRLWSESFDRVLDDIFAIQDEIAEQVATALSVTLGVGDIGQSDDGTRNYEAYDAYLEGLAGYNAEGHENVANAISRLEEAVRIDPGYCRAWSQLARTYWFAAEIYNPDQADSLVEKAIVASQRAAEAAPDSISSLLGLGLGHQLQRRPLEADRCLRKALERAPRDIVVRSAYSDLLAHTGYLSDATANLEICVNTDPLSQMFSRQYAEGLHMCGRTDEAIREFHRGQTLDGSRAFAWTGLALVGMAENDPELIRVNMERFMGTYAGSDHINVTRPILELLEDRERGAAYVRKIVAERDRHDRLTYVVMALWASYFGADEVALEIYQSLTEVKFNAWFTLWRRVHRNMRTLPGFRDLVTKLGYVEYWRGSDHWPDFARPIGDDDFECW